MFSLLDREWLNLYAVLLRVRRLTRPILSDQT